MKRSLLLTTIMCFLSCAFLNAQNVFDPTLPLVTYSSNAPLGSAGKPDPEVAGLQRWVYTPTKGVSGTWSSGEVSAFKSYYVNRNGNKIAFRLKYPKSYTTNPTAKFPLLLFFHGLGEAGCTTNGGIYNNEKQLLIGARDFANKVENGTFDGFLLYPQVVAENNCVESWAVDRNNNMNAINAIIDSLIKYARLDEDRIVVNGLSDGGAEAWNYTRSNPKRVAALAPSSATTTASFSSFVHIPIWFATGGKDSNPSPAQAQATYANGLAAGADIRYTVFPNGGHGIWTNHWREAGYMEYLAAGHKANPLVFFGRDEFCPGDPIDAKLGITGGHNAYEWEKDGIVIARKISSAENILVPGPIVSFTGNEITVRELGTYRARFRRSSTAAWSEWSPVPVVIKEKQPTQTPPIQVVGLKSKVLPAPDGSTSVALTLPDGYAGYQWFNATTDDLLDTNQVFNAGVGEYKAQVIEEGACSGIVSPIFKVVSASGNPKPEPARNLTATALSPSSIQLDWNDNPNAGSNETGFEIYRSDATGGPYTLIFITAPNVTTYLNTNLKSNTAYYYLVRAVNDFGAAATTNEATVQTQVDNAAPTAPNNLQYRGSTMRSVSLRWTASTDGAGIKRYDVYANGKKTISTTATSATVQNLDSLTTYTFTVKAVDNNNNESAPSNQVIGRTHRQGVNYKYYNGIWTQLPDFDDLTPVKEGTFSDVVFGIGIRTQSDNYAIYYEGYIYIPVTGTYFLGVRSNDGSKLYINQDYSDEATPFVNNDGTRSTPATVINSINLTQGYHRFVATYFERDGSEAMELRWRSPDAGVTSEERIPSGFLSYESFTLPGSPAEPGNLAASASAYNRINLSWTDNTGGQGGHEIQRATSLTGTYSAFASVLPGETTFTDTTVTANKPYWYKVRSVLPDAMSAYVGPVTATTQAAPATPTSPNNLSAQLVDKNTIQLTFNDRASNENGFEIQRSVGVNNAFRKIAQISANPAGGTTTFVDSSLFSNVQYYYRVRAIGIVNFSPFSNTSSATTGNLPPVMTNVRDFTMKQNTTFVLPINATDPDGDALTFNLVNFPAFATLEEESNGNANITFRPRLVHKGTYSLQIIVGDGNNGFDTTYFRMAVNSNSVPSMSAIPDVTLNEGAELNIPISATDVEGNQKIAFKFTDLPSFATFTNNGNGNGTIKLQPWFAHSGTYTTTVLADDGLGAWTSRTFTITVNNVDTTVNDGTTPVKPLNLVAETIINRGIELRWEDRAYNETDYKVYRADNAAGPFTVVNTGINLRNRTSFLDSTVAPYINYYYYVVGENAAGTGISSDTATALTANAIPVISAIEDISVKADASVQRNFTVTDNAGEVVTVTIQNKPSFVSLLDLGNGNYRIVAAPGNNHLGWYNITVVARDDQGGESTRSFAMLVSDKATRSVYINLGPTVVPQPWNNWATPNTPGSITNLIDQSRAATSFGITSSSTWSDINLLGHVTGNNSGIFPDSVLAAGIVENSTATRKFTVTGLNPAMRYNLVFVGSKNEGLDSRTEYRVTGTSNRDTLNARYNVRLSANLNNITPNASGQITVDVTKLSGNGTSSYLNAIVIEEFAPADALLSPVNVYAEPIDRNTVSISWSDRLVNENVADGYQLQRATNADFSMNLETINLPGNTTEYKNTGLNDNTRYFFRVRAKVGTSFTGYSNVAETITPRSIVYINFNFNVASAGSPWNNLENSPNLEDDFPNLTDQSGANSGLRLWLVSIFNGEFNLGKQTGNNSGVVPDNVLAANYWLDKTQLSQMKVSGLDHTKRYRFGFIGSSGPSWAKGDYTATYTIGDRTVYLNSWENTSKIVYIGDVIPDENGEVMIDFSTTEEALYGFNAGMIIHAYDDHQGGTVVNKMVIDNEGVYIQGTGPAQQILEEAKFPVRVYPNPFSNLLRIDFHNSDASNLVSVELYDMSGRLSYRQNYGRLGKGVTNLRLNAGSRLKNGVYMYTLSVNGKPIQTGKIVKTD